MTYFKSLPDHAGPRTIFTAYPDIYRAWSEMSEAIMNGPSDLNQGEREMILAFAAGVMGCPFVAIAHAEVAYAWGIAPGLVEQLLADFEAAQIEAHLRPLLAFVRKLAKTPAEMSQADADAVFAAGWSEKSLHDAIAVTGRAAFMQRLVQGYGFTPLTREEASKRAKGRIELGYVNLFPQFSKEGK